MAKFGFSTADVDMTRVGGGSREPIPRGDYTLRALEAEEKNTKDGRGSYIAVKFEVTGGEHDGHWIFQNFNINNPSDKAQLIGRQQIVAWATACGKPNADDTDKLLEKPFRATVGIEKGTGGYADRNIVVAFLADDAEKPASTTKSAPAKPAAAKAAPGKATNPWD